MPGECKWSCRRESATMRVLIADDQRVVREGLATILSTIAGTEVVGLAADGNEAVALYGETRPDVVLMDLRMPNLDGVGAIRGVRNATPTLASSCSPPTPMTSPSWAPFLPGPWAS